MKANRKNSAGLEPIDGIIAKVLATGKLGNFTQLAELWGEWKDIAGEDVAQHCFPEKVAGQKLYIKVDSPIWRQQLDLLKEELKEKIENRFENVSIEKIVLR
jgi:predicted nucleic acid-binding Zn ribbon protein